MIKHDYIFNYSISTRPYDRNTDAAKTYALQWGEKRGTVNGFLQDIKNGYAYCPTFNHEGDTFSNGDKTKNNLKATYFITFDFDAVRLTAEEFYGCMMGTALTPSMVYTTANDGHFKAGKDETYCNRYRVIYLIDEPITTAETYTAIHKALKSDIAATVNDDNIYNDNSDKDVSHFFAGNTQAETYSNSRVVSLTWLFDRYGIRIHAPIDSDTLPNSEQTPKRVKKCQAVDYQKKKKVVFNGMTKNDPFSNTDTWQEFLNDYNDPSTTFNRLTFNYRGRLPLLPTATDIQPYINEGNKHKLYIEVDSEYTELVYKRVKVAKRDKNGQKVERWENARFYDGMGRRRKIFIHCLLLRLITPTATRVQILWGAANFMVDYIDNKQDPITKREVSRIVDDVMGKDLQEWQGLKRHHQRTFKVNKAVAAARNIAPRQAALRAQNERATDAKTVKWETIAKHYDPTKTDKQNIELLAANGVNVSLSTLQRFKRENGYTKHGKASRGGTIAAYYDPQLTDGQNLEQLAANGVNVSLKTLKRWKSENGYTKQRAKNTQEPNRAVESFFNAVGEDLTNEQTRCKQGANVGYFPSLDVEDLANEFLRGGTAEHETVKPSKTCKDFDPWDFYKSHNPEGVKYGRDVTKDREQAAKIGQEMETSGIDYNSMTDDEFWQMLFDSKQEVCTAATLDDEIEDEPF